MVFSPLIIAAAIVIIGIFTLLRCCCEKSRKHRGSCGAGTAAFVESAFYYFSRTIRRYVF
jgi:hypothetical protein